MDRLEKLERIEGFLDECGDALSMALDRIKELGKENKELFLKTQELEGLIPFVEKILDHQTGWLNGCDIEEYAVECGILEIREVTEPCGDNCECAYPGFPTECYFLTNKYKTLRGEAQSDGE